MICEGKRMYRTMGAANKAARGAKRFGIAYLRVYQCQSCGAFHMTSSTPEKYESKRMEHRKERG
jgi:hypothetical protein